MAKQDTVSAPYEFDVVCTIGTVQFDDGSSESAHVAAFRLIGEHNAEGDYSFPMGDGRTCAVAVRHESDH